MVRPVPDKAVLIMNDCNTAAIPLRSCQVGHSLNGVTPTVLSIDLSTDRDIKYEPNQSGSFLLPTKQHLLYKICLNLSRVNPGPLALPTIDKHVHLPRPPLTSQLAGPASPALSSSGRLNSTKGPKKEFSQDTQPGEVFTQGQILDTFTVGLSKTTTLPSLSHSQRHEFHNSLQGHTLGGGEQLLIVFTLSIIGNVIWKLYLYWKMSLDWKMSLGRQKVLFGLWRRSPSSLLFFRVQIDVGSHSISRRGMSGLAGVSTLVA